MNYKPDNHIENRDVLVGTDITRVMHEIANQLMKLIGKHEPAELMSKGGNYKHNEIIKSIDWAA